MSATAAALPVVVTSRDSELDARDSQTTAITRVESRVPDPESRVRHLKWLQASRRSIPAARIVAAIDTQGMLTIALSTHVFGAAFAPSRLNDLLTTRIRIADVRPLVVFGIAVLAVFEAGGPSVAALVRRRRVERRTGAGRPSPRRPRPAF